jgi:hypothetical protein
MATTTAPIRHAQVVMMYRHTRIDSRNSNSRCRRRSNNYRNHSRAMVAPRNRNDLLVDLAHRHRPRHAVAHEVPRVRARSRSCALTVGRARLRPRTSSSSSRRRACLSPTAAAVATARAAAAAATIPCRSRITAARVNEATRRTRASHRSHSRPRLHSCTRNSKLRVTSDMRRRISAVDPHRPPHTHTNNTVHESRAHRTPTRNGASTSVCEHRASRTTRVCVASGTHIHRDLSSLHFHIRFLSFRLVSCIDARVMLRAVCDGRPECMKRDGENESTRVYG